MRTDDVTFALWLIEELRTEDAVNVLRVILPDSPLPLLRTLAVMCGCNYEREDWILAALEAN